MSPFLNASTLDQFRQSPAADPETLRLLQQTQNFETSFNQIYRDRYGEP